MIKKITKKFLYLVMALAIVASCCVVGGNSAKAVKKVKKEPIVMMTTKEILKSTSISRNRIIIEKCVGVVDNANGDGHLIGNKNFYIYYGDLRYKGKRLKKGTIVMSYLPCCPDKYLTTICSYDYIKVKNKKGKKVWKLIDVRF